MIVAISEDGFITDGDDPNPGNWTSHEDKAHFRRILKAYDVYFMGHATYAPTLPLITSDKTVYVWTKNADLIKSHEPNIHFISNQLDVIYKKLQEEHANVLLLGGAKTYRQFLEAGFVNDIWLTIEPIRLHDGVRLFTNAFEELKQYDFKIIDDNVVNSKGTRILHLQKQS